MLENAGQKKLRIWTLFTQCCLPQILLGPFFNTLTRLRRNLSLAAHYLLQITRCPLLILYSLFTRFRNYFLLVAKLAIHSIKNHLLQESLVTRYKIHPLLVGDTSVYSLNVELNFTASFTLVCLDHVKRETKQRKCNLNLSLVSILRIKKRTPQDYLVETSLAETKKRL